MMNRKNGLVFMLVGFLLILSAAGLLLHNRREDDAAGRAAREAALELRLLLKQTSQDSGANEQDGQPAVSAPAAACTTGPFQENFLPAPERPEILAEDRADVYKEPAVSIDGNAYIGILEVPALQLTLPIMKDWSYRHLKLAPCRYAGEAAGPDFVLAAHNYSTHFGKLPDLPAGEKIIFTDVDQHVYTYEVEALEIVAPEDIAGMTHSGYDLSLFTCDYSGGQRLTLRCRKTSA